MSARLIVWIRTTVDLQTTDDAPAMQMFVVKTQIPGGAQLIYCFLHCVGP